MYLPAAALFVLEQPVRPAASIGSRTGGGTQYMGWGWGVCERPIARILAVASSGQAWQWVHSAGGFTTCRGVPQQVQP